MSKLTVFENFILTEYQLDPDELSILPAVEQAFHSAGGKAISLPLTMPRLLLEESSPDAFFVRMDRDYVGVPELSLIPIRPYAHHFGRHFDGHITVPKLDRHGQMFYHLVSAVFPSHGIYGIYVRSSCTKITGSPILCAGHPNRGWLWFIADLNRDTSCEAQRLEQLLQ
jgi:hypothetical protein